MVNGEFRLAGARCTVAGAEPQLDQHGQSLVGVLNGTDTRNFALNEWELLPTRTGVALSLRTVRTKTHKLTVDLQSGAGEMYDLGADPHERANLWDSSDEDHLALKAQMLSYIASRPDDAVGNQVQVGMA